jgi:hypothetical protein
MSNLANEVLGQLDASQIDAIASQLGVDPAQAEGAIQQAMPLLLGGLARNASTPDGAGALHAALGDHGGTDIGGLLGGMLGGGGGTSGGLDNGMAILGHIFGARQDQASQGLGQASGLGSANASQLLAMLAPIVMSVLANRSQSQGMSASSLGGLLGQEHQQMSQGSAGGLLGAVFDQDGDGQFGLSDLMKIGQGMLGGRRPA